MLVFAVLYNTRAEKWGHEACLNLPFIPRLFWQKPIPAQCPDNKPQIGGRKNNTQVLWRVSVVINAAVQRTTSPMAWGCQVNRNEKYKFYLLLTAAPIDLLFVGETWKILTDRGGPTGGRWILITSKHVLRRYCHVPWEAVVSITAQSWLDSMGIPIWIWQLCLCMSSCLLQHEGFDNTWTISRKFWTGAICLCEAVRFQIVFGFLLVSAAFLSALFCISVTVYLSPVMSHHVWAEREQNQSLFFHRNTAKAQHHYFTNVIFCS